MDKEIKTIHSWKNISLVEEFVPLPNGKNVVHTSICHPGAAVILPITEEGEIVLIKQFRPSLKKWFLELPAGTIEPNESVLSCAMRELEEETGYNAETIIPMGQVTPLAGFCDEIQHLFIAKDLTSTQHLTCDDDEVIEVVLMPLEMLEQKIVSGEVSDAKTIACLSKAKLSGFI
ncbi:NUDIX hydrolase [Vibrio caribbeanicus]|uniref:GDP-mannose pyrophosphatase n=1 Tax=Vibrio caribbeanicus ATCC BAA-2122 TaxID=796620 RepID=E3BMJ9_9VIBR|nr:NUDIX hydrolase [Vibrio caribbeanicus]EFP95744.1 MutT/nudix family protein [Vibrio caribbeanicus ATCC BAA-2122]